MCTISVIIPNYNHALFLKKRIESVLNQTYQNFEVIILDDCSTDSSRDIIEQYRKHPKVSAIVYNKKNSSSPFKQWKKGIDLAKGDLIWIAESDDWSELGFLSEMVQPFFEFSDLVLAYCQLLCLRENKIKWKTEVDLLNEIIEGKKYNIQHMLGYNGIPNASGVIFKKNCFLAIEEEYLDMKYCGDWFVWSQICRQGKIFISGKYLNYFNKHDGDVSGEATKNGLDFIEGNKIFLNIVENDKPPIEFIQIALSRRVSRLNNLKGCFNDPHLYLKLKDEFVRFYEKYNLNYPHEKVTLVKKLKNIARQLYLMLIRIK
jgi:glycosyltransferase involved in cell wall biosynthesis